MSLKVWLPLNGTLENKGISNLTITSNNITVENNGKIGKSYSFNSGYIRSAAGECNITRNHWSVGCWFYPTSSSASAHQYLIGIHRGSTASNFQFVLCFYSNTLALRTGNTTRKGPNISLNTWHHGMAVYNGTNLYFYLDGTLSSTTTLPATQDATASTLFIGMRSGDAGYFFGKMNDIRIYDNALSAVEVKEIAQGLVLHYKLDSEYNENTTNLAAGVIGYDYISKDVAQYATSIQGKTVYGNKIFTYSAYIKNTSDHPLAVRFNPYNAADTSYSAFYGNYIQPGQEGRSIVTVDITDTSKWNGKVILYIQNGNAGTVPTNKTFYIKEVQVEEKNHATPFTPNTRNNTIIQDSSGYNYNGTILGTPTISNDTIRYSNCMSFPTNTDGILSTFPLALWNNAFTYSFWIKPSGENGGRSIYAASYSGVSCSIEKTTGNKLRFYWNGSPDLTTSSLTITDGVWQHIAVVKSEDKTKVYCYYNGELKDTFTNTFSDKTFSGNLRIARDTRGDATSYTGLMSDFRIYCTPLLDTDIKQLYNVGMKVDKGHNIHVYEFQEQNINLFSSIPWTDSYNTHSTTTNLFTNYNTKNEPQFVANVTSAGSDFIEITPGIYEYDYTISVNAGNQFYIGFQRYDADKTSRSNAACVYTYATKPSSDVVKQRYKGTVDLSTDGVNPIKYITLRILNGWSGTTSGVTGQTTIHNFSLKLKSVAINPSLKKTGQLINGEMKEQSSVKFYKDHIIEANQFIER